MTQEKYNKQINGIGLYAEICIDSSKSNGLESTVIDACSWKMLREAHINLQLGEGHYKWRAAVLKGIRFAISKIETDVTYEIRLLDIDGHILHSNLHSMFAVGLLSVFKELRVDINENDLAALHEFVHSSKGYNSIWEEPNENKLHITNYKA
jgi:hypothetical protein